MNSLAKAYYVTRYLGSGFVARRLCLDIRRRLGITRRLFRPRPWDTLALSDILVPGIPADGDGYAAYKHTHLPPFLFPFGSPPTLPAYCLDAPTARALSLRERIALLKADRCIYFFSQPSSEAIDWYHNPFENTRAPSDCVWCDIPDFEPFQGDPRVMWEPSRAAWAFDLAMAAARGMDEPLQELYWRWVDSWMTACPPFQGFQWKCGQESSVRFIAIMFGLWALGMPKGQEGLRWRQMVRLAWATGFRVYHHIGYAVSQNNNHALSEACGLMLIGHLFPELRAARQWGERGRRVLAAAMRGQIASDGSYIQHSMNYHRVMLQVCTLALRIAELRHEPMPEDLTHKHSLAVDFLLAGTDEATGRPPNYGNNDGAWVLPLSETHPSDHRGAVQSASLFARPELPLPMGHWDEEAVWLFGDRALSASRRVRGRETGYSPVGGYYRIQSTDSWGMVRCHSYRSRPSQYDPLHFDLWWKGVNILKDRGTYRYYNAASRRLESSLRGLAAHNTVEVDGATPVHWITRFLCLPFPRALARGLRGGGSPSQALTWSGVSLDYARSPWQVTHARTIITPAADLWLVVDELSGCGRHCGTLRWQLPTLAVKAGELGQGVEVETSQGPCSIRVVVSPTGASEWRVIMSDDAPSYNTLEQGRTLEVDAQGVLPIQFITTVFLGHRSVDTRVQLVTPSMLAIECGRLRLQVEMRREKDPDCGTIITGAECRSS